MEYAKGNYVIIMDADLSHHVNLNCITILIEKIKLISYFYLYFVSFSRNSLRNSSSI